MRECTRCNIEKHEAEFSSRGNEKLHNWCKSCVKEYDKNRYLYNKERIKQNKINYKKKLKKWEIKLKTETPCADCNKYYHHSMMQWDHLPEFEKINSPRWFLHHGKMRKALEEMEKCELVCANCHCFRTWSRSSVGRA